MYTQTSQTFFSNGLVLTGGNCIGGDIFCTAQMVITVINSVLVPLLFAIAFIVFLYGVAKAYIFSAGDPEAVKGGHKLILWGVIGFAVMISLWGLVNVVANTFGLTGSYAPPPPYSPYMTGGTTGTTGSSGTRYCDNTGSCI